MPETSYEQKCGKWNLNIYKEQKSMENYEKDRNYGIDFLRLVLMYMVCILHVLGQGGILKAVTPGTTKYIVYWLLEIASYCATDAFAIISGYTSKLQHQKYDKIINMWFQVFFYSFILTSILRIIGLADVENKTLIKQAFPVTFGSYWYFTAYFGMFFALPLLNYYIASISVIKAKQMMLIILILFCGLGIINDPFNTGYGYSMMWLVVLYIVGALSKKLRLFENRKTAELLISLVVCIFINLLILVATGIKKQINYVSPTVLYCAIILVVLFSRMKMSGRIVTIIKRTSRWAFGIYLFQLNYVIWNQYLQDRFSVLAESNVFYGFITILLCAGAIFISGLSIEALRDTLHRFLHLSRLCTIIADKIERNVRKFSALIR